MKKVLVIIMISVFGFFGANAQTKLPKADNVEVSTKNSNIYISWVSNYSEDVNWKLEASADNKNFT